ncbi:MAG TPA: hypothetical protein VMN38_03895 [Sphingomicrobium sp.]|nr:hypothetical protein [Sphingomicrobium sp.]
MSARLSDTDITDIAALCPRLYEAVGWDEKRVPNWDEFRRCCHEQATLIPMGSGEATPIPLETFIEGMEGQRSSGAVKQLSETELGNAVQGFGSLASVRSTFVATIDGHSRRGVTFALVVRQSGRWAILSVAWENEAEEGALPAEYL